MRLDKVKRPAGVFSFRFRFLEQDGYGIWLYAPVGAAWVAPHDRGAMPVDVVALVKPGRSFVTWWVDDPAGRRVDIDICLPPEKTADGWTYIDLELDVSRREPDVVVVHDHDEFEAACRNGWITPPDAATAKTTAVEMQEVLQRRIEPWGDEGWRRLIDAKTSTPSDGLRART